MGYNGFLPKKIYFDLGASSLAKQAIGIIIYIL